MTLGVAAGAVLAAVWAGWFLRSRVSVYAVTESARIEVERAAHPVQASASGRVVSLNLALDRWVEVGDPLVELDAEALRLDLAEKRARLAGIPAQLAALEKQIAAKQAALQEHRRATAAHTAEARARQREADAVAGFTEAEAKRATLLREDGLVSDVDLARSRSEGLARRAAADAQRLAVGRLAAEQLMAERDIEADVAELERTAEELRTQKGSLEASIAAATHQIELRTLRAPIAGQLGEAAPLQVGAVLEEGARVAVVVPRRELRVVADFPPATVVGRVRPGQPGWMRLDGFPWVQYGTLPLTVTGVGSELRDGKVRVELRIAGTPPAGVPLQHGLPGMVEVEIERIKPLDLVVRAAGRALQSAPVEPL
ncbi:HlyD family efflux transporter periplasmic adaptor subunit [Sorangium sp. So ce590]|uniref:HlyD family secretion protein n=1 Tax=Sorangium sp. So ce590 TaxID=3133317 RepID=UPI003F602CD7